MTDYRATTCIPELVHQARAVAAEMNFSKSCSDAVGRMLSFLATQKPEGAIGEIGTGCGVGAAWIVSGMTAGTRFTTIELDPEQARRAGELFAAYPDVQVVQGDWHDLDDHGPFDLLFSDSRPAKQHEPETVLNMLAPHGLLVMDDMMPENQWPQEWRGQPDPIRHFWLNDPRVQAVELLLSATEAVILATRMSRP